MTEKSIAKEALELAIEIENNGRLFYETVARLSRNEEVEGVLAKLAVLEKEHETTFRSMLARLGGYRPDQEYAGEHYQYIRNLAESSIFVGERVQALLTRKPMTDVEAMEVGMGFEKDSILFYSEMRGMVPRHDQQIVDVIINEEKNHLSELTYMTNRLRGNA